MVDGALDFLALVLVLGIVTGTSLNLTIPLVKEVNSIVYTEIDDKTASNLKGETGTTTDWDGCMAFDELILTIMGQTYFMPRPRLIDVCGNIMSIKAEEVNEAEEDAGYDPGGVLDGVVEFEPNSLEIGVWVKQVIQNWYNSSELYGRIAIKNVRFAVEYTTGDTESEADDMYAVYVLYQDEYEDKPSLHKCLEHGRIG